MSAGPGTPFICVVIPAYDASRTLPGVLERIPAATAARISKLIVVEDGGEKVPPSVSQALRERYPKLETCVHERNRGYGGAQKTGLRRSLELGADFAVILHADGQYAPEVMDRLLEPLLAGECEVVLGSRMKNPRDALKGGMPVYKFVANLFLTRLENLCLGMNLSEFHSGYMLYSRRALKTIPFERLSDTFHFDGEMLMMAGKRRLRIADVAIPTHYGDEKSHLNPITYGFDVLRILWLNFRGKYS